MEITIRDLRYAFKGGTKQWEEMGKKKVVEIPDSVGEDIKRLRQAMEAQVVLLDQITKQLPQTTGKKTKKGEE